MQEDTAKSFIKVNFTLITTLLAVGAAFVTLVAWGIRLESKSQEQERTLIRQDLKVERMEDKLDLQRTTTGNLDTKFQVIDEKLNSIKSTIDSIKTTQAQHP